MSIGELSGYAASVLVFMTFYMKTMIPLRFAGLASNIAFIIYASVEGLFPILILHSALLPLNVLRLYQLQKMIDQARTAVKGELSLESLLPYMSRALFKAGDVLFRAGDESNEIFYINNGVVRLQELGITIGTGETLGEVSIFTFERKRTATAVCETDCELLRMPDDKVLELYNQNPRFGFHLVRVITSRLLENYVNLKDSMVEMRPLADDVSSTDGAPQRSITLENQRGAAIATAPKHLWRRPYLSALVLLTVAGLLLGAIYAEPYLRSVLIRDAVVTTRINIATSPIQGVLEGALPVLGDNVGAREFSLRVRNPLADNRDAVHLTAEIDRSEANIAAQEAYVAQLELHAEAWRKRTAEYAAEFEHNLSLTITNSRRDLAAVSERSRLAQKSYDRIVQLTKSGAASERDVEEALNQMMRLESNKANLESIISDADLRRSSMERNVFIASDGSSPDWAYRISDQLTLQITEAVKDLEVAKAALVKTRIEAKSALELYEHQYSDLVSVPPHSIVWSVYSNEGETVTLGTPVLEWIGCRNLLVDVPVNDAQIGLLRTGMRAQVIVEGESNIREGYLLYTRGAAAKLGRTDLAAVAKGHSPGSGQAILRLESHTDDNIDCPVGRAAWVDFPELHLVDVIRARLRL